MSIKSTATIGHAKGMSALPPKAGMCGAVADVCFEPIADTTKATRCGLMQCTKRSLFDHFVGDLLEMHRHFEAQRLGRLHIDHQLELRGLQDR